MLKFLYKDGFCVEYFTNKLSELLFGHEVVCFGIQLFVFGILLACLEVGRHTVVNGD